MKQERKMILSTQMKNKHFANRPRKLEIIKQNQEDKTNCQNFLFRSSVKSLKSIGLGSSDLLCTNREELGDNFERHSLGFWDFHVNKHP